MARDKREVIRVGPLLGRTFFDSPDAWRVFDAPFGSWPPLVVDSVHPKIEEHVCDGELIVRVELPGIDPDHDAEVWVADDVLHIKAERHNQHEHHGEGYFRSEFRYGSFLRSLPLPKGAARGDIAASYKDGILEVHIPLEPPQKEVSRVPIARE